MHLAHKRRAVVGIVSGHAVHGAASSEAVCAVGAGGRAAVVGDQAVGTEHALAQRLAGTVDLADRLAAVVEVVRAHPRTVLLPHSQAVSPVHKRRPRAGNRRRG